MIKSINEVSDLNDSAKGARQKKKNIFKSQQSCLIMPFPFSKFSYKLFRQQVNNLDMHHGKLVVHVTKHLNNAVKIQTMQICDFFFFFKM